MFATTSKAVRIALDVAWPGRRGADAVASHVTEWFPGILTSEQDTAHGAASFAGGLTRMVQTGVVRTFVIFILEFIPVHLF